MPEPYLSDPDVTLYHGDALDFHRGAVAAPVSFLAVTSWTERGWCLAPSPRGGPVLLQRRGCAFDLDDLVTLCRDCHHDAPTIPATVLDVFAGSGTTLLVARKLGRRSVGIELNEDYCALAADRLAQQSLLAEAGA